MRFFGVRPGTKPAPVGGDWAVRVRPSPRLTPSESIRVKVEDQTKSTQRRGPVGPAGPAARDIRGFREETGRAPWKHHGSGTRH